MKRFLAITITFFCLSSILPWACYSGSLPEKGQGGTVKGVDKKHGKDATGTQEKSREDSSIEKTKDKDGKEPEYDMDFDIDFNDERCQHGYQYNC